MLVAVLCALALFALLVLASIQQYRHFELTLDYGLFNQAEHQLTSGQLSPYSSLFSKPYMTDHGAFLLYILAPFYWVGGSSGGFLLLILQDAALAGSVVVAARLLLTFLNERGATRSLTFWCLGVLLLSCLVDPWIYAVTYQDFHYEAFGTIFALLLTYDLYAGHRRRAWLWVLLVAAIGDVGGTYLVGLGAGAAITLPHRRIQGAVIATTGFLWVLFLGLVHADTGSVLNTYSYLAGTAVTSGSGAAGLLAILKGLLIHPGRAFAPVRAHLHEVLGNLIPGGVLGLFEPLVGFICIVVIVTGIISTDPVFVDAGFQNTPLYFFIPLGTVLLLSRFPWHKAAARASLQGLQAPHGLLALMSALIVLAMLAFDLPRIHDRSYHPYHVLAATATELGEVLNTTQPATEVVASFGIVGRFSSRPWVYAISRANYPVPIKERLIEFIFAPEAGNLELPSADTIAAEAWVAGRLRAKLTSHSAGVDVYTWVPGKARGTIVLP
jgi:hypothetical protein